jgi:ATP-dependent helicase YprA (DUF1998 family)
VPRPVAGRAGDARRARPGARRPAGRLAGWADPLLVDRLRLGGVERPWEHQVQAAELAHGGSSVVVATGTASGKSLAYLLPSLTALLADERAGALYLSPDQGARDRPAARAAGARARRRARRHLRR